MTNEEILKRANEICNPYNVTVEIMEGISSVGVQGDGRTYTPVICLKSDFQNWDILAELSNRISSELPINRITYEITSLEQESPKKRRIEKKVWTEFFEEILSGEKNFELRFNNFECDVGDVLVLQEWDNVAGKYTGRVLEKEVMYVLKTKEVKFWPKEDIEKHGFQIISFK